MEANQLLSADVLDILFEGRNKKYGAYELRKMYSRRMLQAMLATLVLFVGVSMVVLNSTSPANVSTKLVVIPEPTMHHLPLPEPTQPAKPQPPAGAQRQKGNQKPNLGNILITQDSTMRIDTMHIPDGPDMYGKEPSNYVYSSPLGGGAGGDGGGGNQNNSNDSGQHVWQTLIKDEKEASFPGGISSWRKFLERQVDAGIPITEGAPEGIYTVMVEFTVRITGELHHVRAVSQHGYGMEEEAVRVIKKGPRWIPASQNGKYVETRHRQPVIFVVQTVD
jgi:protein TonB